MESDVAPGFEAIPDSVEETDPIGPDDWYDVEETDTALSSDADLAANEASEAFEAWDTTQNRIIAVIAVLLLLLAGVAGMIWRRRRREAVVQSAPSTAFASGIRNSIANQMPSLLQDTPDWAKGDAGKDNTQPKAEEPMDLVDVLEPEPAAEVEKQSEPEPEITAPLTPREPARLDLDLDIESATRSLMMFTVEFSLEIANRSDHAVRDLTVAAKLDSAQRGASNAAPIAGGQPIAEIVRIGPQQSQRVKGTLQLPLAEVTPIRQGSKPLLIPLIHITLEGNGQSAMNRSFVLGTPSAAGTGRVHPLPLDAPPGGLPPLRAQAIKQPGEDDTQATETV